MKSSHRHGVFLLLVSSSVGFVAAVVAISLVMPSGGQKAALSMFLVLLAPLPVYALALFQRVMDEHMVTARRFATRDVLIDLYNQNTFWDFLNYAIERSKRQQ